MSADDNGAAVEAHGLLVCRGVLESQDRHVTVQGILEILPVAAFPGDAGPVSFVAFVRAKRAGEAQVSFRVHPLEAPATTVAEFPGRLSVAKGYEGRQTVVRVEMKTLKVNQGGWFGLEFRVGDEVLMRNRFLIGAVAPRPAAPAPAPKPSPPA